MSLTKMTINNILPGSTHHSAAGADSLVGSIVPPSPGTITGIGVHAPTGFTGPVDALQLSVVIADVATLVLTLMSMADDSTAHTTFTVPYSAGNRIEVKAVAHVNMVPINPGPVDLGVTLEIG